MSDERKIKVAEILHQWRTAREPRLQDATKASNIHARAKCTQDHHNQGEYSQGEVVQLTRQNIYRGLQS